MAAIDYGGWARGVRPLLAALLLVVGAQRASAQTEVVEYYGQDALGSIRIVFDAQGAAIARADYEPFGELFTVPSMPGTSELPAKQFTGQERDAEASLDYFGARFYQPRTGRCSEIDPVYSGLFDPQQWNRYAYVGNDPHGHVDPDGRCEAKSNTGAKARWDPGSQLWVLPNQTVCSGEGTMPSTGAAFGTPSVGTASGPREQGNDRRVQGVANAKSKKSAVFVVSMSGGQSVFSGEVGTMFEVDSDAGTVDAYTYWGVGAGVGSQDVYTSFTVNTEVGIKDAASNLAGDGWQLSAFAAVGMNGAAGSLTFPWLSAKPMAGVAGWSAGLGVGASAIYTRTTHRGTFDLHDLPRGVELMLRFAGWRR